MNLNGARWRKSSLSGGSGDGNDSCVEVALLGNATALRDSKNAEGPVLRLPNSAWQALLDTTR
ncbi:DUF397 domain-containing protein [Actinophytocola sp. KF-1]